jgi:hypothetical protein
MMVRPPYLNVVRRSCCEGAQNGNQTHVLWLNRDGTLSPGIQTMCNSVRAGAAQAKWPAARSQRAGAPISLRQACTISAEETKRAQYIRHDLSTQYCEGRMQWPNGLFLAINKSRLTSKFSASSDACARALVVSSDFYDSHMPSSMFLFRPPHRHLRASPAV